MLSREFEGDENDGDSRLPFRRFKSQRDVFVFAVIVIIVVVSFGVVIIVVVGVVALIVDSLDNVITFVNNEESSTDEPSFASLFLILGAKFMSRMTSGDRKRLASALVSATALSKSLE